jgi:hypothetical protein
LPGFAFSRKFWDDEVGWHETAMQKQLLSYIFLRDAPGYSIPAPRLVMWLISRIPLTIEIQALTLHVFVYTVQAICFFYLLRYLSSLGLGKNIRKLLPVFLLFPIEDLNYLHNVGYLAIFPVLYSFERYLKERKLKYGVCLLIISLIAITKPISAIIILAYFCVRIFQSRNQTDLFLIKNVWIISLFCAYILVYLSIYYFLPHSLNIPFNSNPKNIFPLIVNFPYILGASLFPALYIGLVGAIRLLQLHSLEPIVGVLLYILPILGLGAIYSKLKRLRLKLDLATKNIIFLFILSYILVYSIGNSYWITRFPLWDLEVPQHIFARWSSTLPSLASSIAIVVASKFVSFKTISFLVWFQILQIILLMIFAHPYLIRWW